MNEVVVKQFSAPALDKRAVMLYSGAKCFTPETEVLYEECLKECLPRTVYRVCYCEAELGVFDKVVSVGGTEIRSADLAKCLQDCERAIVFAATVGLEYDRLIASYGRLNAAKALMFQAIGTERVESLCDAFCRELKESKNTTPRFSPGYGDLPLETQRAVFAMLGCGTKIGVYLNDSLLMTPSKSVTAIIGIKRQDTQ